MNESPIRTRMILVTGAAIVLTLMGGFVWLDYRESQRVRAKEAKELQAREEERLLRLLEMAANINKNQKLYEACVRDRQRILLEIASLESQLENERQLYVNLGRLQQSRAFIEELQRRAMGSTGPGTEGSIPPEIRDCKERITAIETRLAELRAERAKLEDQIRQPSG